MLYYWVVLGPSRKGLLLKFHLVVFIYILYCTDNNGTMSSIWNFTSWPAEFDTRICESVWNKQKCKQNLSWEHGNRHAWQDLKKFAKAHWVHSVTRRQFWVQSSVISQENLVKICTCAYAIITVKKELLTLGQFGAICSPICHHKSAMLKAVQERK